MLSKCCKKPIVNGSKRGGYYAICSKCGQVVEAPTYKIEVRIGDEEFGVYGVFKNKKEAIKIVKVKIIKV